MSKTKALKPPIPWYGGKNGLVNWILPVIESYKFDSYIEPFGGSGAVLFAKKPGFDVYNDKFEHVVNLYKVLRDREAFKAFNHYVNLMPYSRKQYKESCVEMYRRHTPGPNGDPVRAAHFFVVAKQSFSSGLDSKGWKASIYNADRRSISRDVSAYLSSLKGLNEVHNRLQDVQIECLDATECVRRYACNESMIYCDPPYPLDTRTGGKCYSHEMTNKEHEQLAQLLLDVPGSKVVSTYEHAIYNELLNHGWTVLKRDVQCSANRHKTSSYEDKKRTECLYCSPNPFSKMLF